MQRIYEASDIIEANILKGLLEQCDIDVYISGFYLQGGVGEIPASGNTCIWVADENVPAAKEIVRTYDNS